MEVILFDHVKGLGRQGDLVKVSDGYFRNFLKPNKLAEYGYVANVMASAQRLGVKKMAMVGNEQFLN